MNCSLGKEVNQAEGLGVVSGVKRIFRKESSTFLGVHWSRLEICCFVEPVKKFHKTELDLKKYEVRVKEILGRI